MASRSKSTNHSKSNSPSKSSSPSQSHAGSPAHDQEKEESTTTAHTHHISEHLSLESPEVQSLIHKLQSFSISPQKSEVSQSSVTSQLNLSHPLTRLQSEKLGIEPTEFPLPKRKKAKKITEVSDSEDLSSISSISTPPLRSQPSTPPLHIVVHQGISTTASQTTHSSTTSSPQSSGIPTVVTTIIASIMADPWTTARCSQYARTIT